MTRAPGSAASCLPSVFTVWTGQGTKERRKSLSAASLTAACRHTPDGNTEISWGPVKGLGGEIHPYRIPREGARKPEKDSEQSLAASRRTLVTQATLRPGPLLHAGPQGSGPLMAWPGRSQGCWLSQRPEPLAKSFPPRGSLPLATFPQPHFLETTFYAPIASLIVLRNGLTSWSAQTPAPASRGARF